MSLSVSGYSQNYLHHSHHHQPQHYHNPQHLPQNSAAGIVGPEGGMSLPCAQHNFYSTFSHHPQIDRFPEPQNSVTAATCSSSSYFPNWMLPTPEISSITGQIPDGYHSFGAPGANSPGGTQYQSFIQYENGVPVRCVKRRVTANKKERRRTLSINNAFSQLRGCIPNVPSDTKLSKIKTLRLATSYISYLMDILAKDDPQLSRTDFKAELGKRVTPGQSGPAAGNASNASGDRSIIANSSGKGECTFVNKISKTWTVPECTDEKEKRDYDGESDTSSQESSSGSDKKPKGRTGWPQHVWAAELK